jgi:hypothetical protein
MLPLIMWRQRRDVGDSADERGRTWCGPDEFGVLDGARQTRDEVPA